MFRYLNFSSKNIKQMVGTKNAVPLSSSSDCNLVEIFRNLKHGKIENTGKSLRIMLDGSNYAEVEYEINGNTFVLQHTSIPDDYQGKGLGSILAERIFDHLIMENEEVKLKLTCDYLQYFYKKNQLKYKPFITE